MVGADGDGIGGCANGQAWQGLLQGSCDGGGRQRRAIVELVMDRGYVDFERLYIFTLSAAFFVVRTKSNVLLQRRYSHPVDKATGVRSDHTVILTAIDSAKAY